MERNGSLNIFELILFVTDTDPSSRQMKGYKETTTGHAGAKTGQTDCH